MPLRARSRIPADAYADWATFVNTLGHTVKRLRQQHRLTQEILAQKAEMARITVARLEQGHGNLSLKHLFTLSQALHTTPDVLLADMNTIHISKKELLKEGTDTLIKRILNE